MSLIKYRRGADGFSCRFEKTAALNTQQTMDIIDLAESSQEPDDDDSSYFKGEDDELLDSSRDTVVAGGDAGDKDEWTAQ